MDYKKIGKKIKDALRLAGYERQIDAAKALDMTQPNLSRIYRGIVGIDNRVIEKVAKITKREMAYFLGDEFSNNPLLYSINERSVPVFTTIPDSFPSYDESAVKGYIRHPYYMMEDVKFILRNPTNIAEEPDDKADNYYFKVDKKPRYGKAMLLKINGKFHIARITFDDEKVTVHYALSGKSFDVKSKDINYIGTLLGIYRDVV